MPGLASGIVYGSIAALHYCFDHKKAGIFKGISFFIDQFKCAQIPAPFFT